MALCRMQYAEGSRCFAFHCLLPAAYCLLPRTAYNFLVVGPLPSSFTAWSFVNVSRILYGPTITGSFAFRPDLMIVCVSSLGPTVTGVKTALLSMHRNTTVANDFPFSISGEFFKASGN